MLPPSDFKKLLFCPGQVAKKNQELIDILRAGILMMRERYALTARLSIHVTNFTVNNGTGIPYNNFLIIILRDTISNLSILVNLSLITILTLF